MGDAMNTAASGAALQLAAIVPAAARVAVLFGGAAAGEADDVIGAAGAALLRRNPRMRVQGFVATREAAALAAGQMTSAAAFRAAEVDLRDYGIHAADCIAYAPEALDGLTPEALARHAEALAEDGQMAFLVADKTDAAAEAIVQMLPEGMQRIVTRLDAETLVLHAARRPRPTVSVQSLLGEALVTARVRIGEPDAFCSAEPGWFFTVNAQGVVNRKLAAATDASIVVRQRATFSNVGIALAATKQLREMFGLIVYELDDHPVRWKEGHEASRYLDFRASHAVQVSTPALAEVVRPYNPHVIVLENQLAELPPTRDYAAEAAAKDGRVTIFFGALNRSEEWRELVPVLERVAARYGDKLEFVVLADTASYRALDVPHKRSLGTPASYDSQFVPYPVYTQALHSADIALLPLHDTIFNRAKSDLKFIESAGHGAAVLASPVVYARTVVDGCTGCLYGDLRAFEAKLVRLIENAPYRQAIARAAYGYVRDHRLLAQHYRERLAAYAQLLAHRAELDRELDARVKEALS